MSDEKLFIGGQWRTGRGPRLDSRDPASGEVIWSGSTAAREDVDDAFAAAASAFDTWADLPFAEREAVARRFAKLLDEHKEKLATAIAREVGKPLWEARTEVATMAGKVDLSVKAYHARTGTTENAVEFGKHVLRHKPHGIVAVFGPYNFPGHLPNGHIVPALLAGNCVLFKPSELTPRVGEETVKLWQAAGIPPGVLQLLQGERATGETIAAHPRLDGLYFTGSSRTGRILNQQFAAEPGKILALEMGGNNPLVVGHVADLRAAVHDIIQSAFLTSGQRCTCARRLFVKAGPDGDALLKQLVNATRVLRVGRWDEEPPPFMGPLVSPAAAQALLTAQKQLTDRGARPLLEMRQLPAGAAFVSPGILDVTDVRDLPDEEYFGPLLQVIRYGTLDQALDLANRTRYGLSAGMLTDREDEYRRFWRRIRAGVVNWNRPTTGASGAFPFGGVGASGNHRASAFYAADYCAYPVSSVEAPKLELPGQLAPGMTL